MEMNWGGTDFSTINPWGAATMFEQLDDESDFLALSGLQHYLFCPRQWALIHVEGLWAENQRTAEGRLLHEKADEPSVEVRGDIWTVRALRLASASLRLAGIADVVEFHRLEPGAAGYEGGVAADRLPPIFAREGAAVRWRVFPVEYKRGKPKGNRCDEAQLCAQAIALEEMLGASIPSGALFYGQTRRRVEVALDEELRGLVRESAAAMNALFLSGRTPAAVYEKHCEACSMIDLCLPRKTATARGAAAWVAREVARATGTEEDA